MVVCGSAASSFLLGIWPPAQSMRSVLLLAVLFVSRVEKALPLQGLWSSSAACWSGLSNSGSGFGDYCGCIPRPHSSTIYQKKADLLISIYLANEPHLRQFTKIGSTSQGADKEGGLASSAILADGSRTCGFLMLSLCDGLYVHMNGFYDSVVRF